MTDLNSSVIRTRHADGCITSSIHRRFPIAESVKQEHVFIPSNEFVGAEMPLQRALRELASMRLGKQSGIQYVK